MYTVGKSFAGARSRFRKKDFNRISGLSRLFLNYAQTVYTIAHSAVLESPSSVTSTVGATANFVGGMTEDLLPIQCVIGDWNLFQRTWLYLTVPVLSIVVPASVMMAYQGCLALVADLKQRRAFEIQKRTQNLRRTNPLSGQGQPFAAVPSAKRRRRTATQRQATLHARRSMVMRLGAMQTSSGASLSAAPKNYRDAHYRRLFELADIDSTGALELDELLTVAPVGIPEKDMRALFERYGSFALRDGVEKIVLLHDGFKSLNVHLERQTVLISMVTACVISIFFVYMKVTTVLLENFNM